MGIETRWSTRNPARARRNARGRLSITAALAIRAREPRSAGGSRRPAGVPRASPGRRTARTAERSPRSCPASVAKAGATDHAAAELERHRLREGPWCDAPRARVQTVACLEAAVADRLGRASSIDRWERCQRSPGARRSAPAARRRARDPAAEGACSRRTSRGSASASPAVIHAAAPEEVDGRDREGKDVRIRASASLISRGERRCDALVGVDMKDPGAASRRSARVADLREVLEGLDSTISACRRAISRCGRSSGHLPRPRSRRRSAASATRPRSSPPRPGGEHGRQHHAREPRKSLRPSMISEGIALSRNAAATKVAVTTKPGRRPEGRESGRPARAGTVARPIRRKGCEGEVPARARAAQSDIPSPRRGRDPRPRRQRQRPRPRTAECRANPAITTAASPAPVVATSTRTCPIPTKVWFQARATKIVTTARHWICSTVAAPS